MRPSALLTPQGKILFDFLVGRIDGGFRIDCAGTAAARSLQAADPLPAAQQGGDRAAGRGRSLRPGTNRPRWTAPSPTGDSPTARSSASTARAPAGIDERPAEEFRALRIREGVAEAETDYPGSDVFPHDVLLDQNGGVSFKKGCFVGQEVVSRMQHRGTARRRLMLIRGERHLTPGANVEAGRQDARHHPVGDRHGRLRPAAGRPRGGGDAARRDVLSADGVPVETTIPPWAGFTLPAAADDEAGVDATGTDA